MPSPRQRSAAGRDGKPMYKIFKINLFFLFKNSWIHTFGIALEFIRTCNNVSNGNNVKASLPNSKRKSLKLS